MILSSPFSNESHSQRAPSKYLLHFPDLPRSWRFTSGCLLRTVQLVLVTFFLNIPHKLSVTYLVKPTISPVLRSVRRNSDLGRTSILNKRDVKWKTKLGCKFLSPLKRIFKSKYWRQLIYLVDRWKSGLKKYRCGSRAKIYPVYKRVNGVRYDEEWQIYPGYKKWR